MTEYPPSPTSIPPWLKLERNPDYRPPVDLTPRVTITKRRAVDIYIEVKVEGPGFEDYILVPRNSLILGFRLRSAKRKLLKRYWLTRKLSDL